MMMGGGRKCIVIIEQESWKCSSGWVVMLNKFSGVLSLFFSNGPTLPTVEIIGTTRVKWIFRCSQSWNQAKIYPLNDDRNAVFALCRKNLTQHALIPFTVIDNRPHPPSPSATPHVLFKCRINRGWEAKRENRSQEIHWVKLENVFQKIFQSPLLLLSIKKYETFFWVSCSIQPDTSHLCLWSFLFQWMLEIF